MIWALMMVQATPPHHIQPAATEGAKWATCLRETAAVFYKTSEPAETIARAAFGNCSNEEESYRRELAKSILISDHVDPEEAIQTAVEVIEKLRPKIAEGIVANVLAARLSARGSP